MPMPEPESEPENLTYRRKAFYLPADSGQLFCLHYLPADNAVAHVLFFPPFAEELNRSRHIMSLTAAQLAAKGYSVLIVDLFGTGDSEGDLIDACWAVWKRDMLQAIDYLQQQKNEIPVNFLTIRLGALLALDILNDSSHTVDINHFIAWQPVINTAKYIKQFLRLQLAANLLNNNSVKSTELLKQKIYEQGSLEISGYPLSARLMDDIISLSDGIKQNTDLSVINTLVLFQLTPAISTHISKDIKQFLLNFPEFREKIDVQIVQGPSFWQNYEIKDNPELRQITLNKLNS